MKCTQPDVPLITMKYPKEMSVLRIKHLTKL